MPKQINKSRVVVDIKGGQPTSETHLSAWHRLWTVLLSQGKSSEPIEEKKHGFSR